MPDLIVDDVEPEIIARLHELAEQEGVDVEEVHRRLLRRVLLDDAGVNPSERDATVRAFGELGENTAPVAPEAVPLALAHRLQEQLKADADAARIRLRARFPKPGVNPPLKEIDSD